MDLILTVLEIVAPVLLIGLAGFAWVKLGFEYRMQFVTQLAMTLSLPCLVFTALMNSALEPSALRDVLLASVAAYAAVTVVMLTLTKAFRLNLQTYLAPLIFGNTGNVGFPLAFFAFGEEGLVYAVMIFAVMAVYSFTAGVWMVSGGGSVARVFKEPVVAATLLGALFLSQGWKTPSFLTNALELVGQLAIPLMLLTLGVAVARLSPRSLGQAFWLSLLKAIICAAIAWGVGRYFGLNQVAFAVLVLQVTTPVAVTSYLLAEKYGTNSEVVSGLVVVSTLLSVGYIPLILAFVI
ncbi:MAG: AEC family transporter [Rhodobacteraceae bacterium]|nr:AEC family transporter [Paracoccaceae bacterium]